jgi:hypothetical protein
MNKADVSDHVGLALIAVSFHRLFLGGLLPSRARFRFAGSPPIRLQSKPAQYRAANLSPNSVSQSRGALQ